MKKRLSILLLLCLYGAWAQAQQLMQWKQIESPAGNLPASVQMYESAQPTITYTAGGQQVTDAFKAYYTIADLSTKQVQVRTLMAPNAQRPSDFAKQSKTPVYMAINGGYFSASTSYSLLVDNGKVLAQNIGALTRPLGTYYPTRGAFGIDAQGKMSMQWVYNVGGQVYAYPQPSPNSVLKTPEPQPTATFPTGGAAWAPQTAIGGGPLLVKNQQKVADYDPEVFQDDIAKSYAPRTAIGYTADGKFIAMVVDGRQTHSRGVSLQVLADLMTELGCVEVLNLDGGGSSAMVAGNGIVLNKPSDGTERVVPTALMLVAGPEVYDTHQSRYSERGSFQDATGSQFGSSPSRVAVAVDGKATARGSYALTGLKAGEYAVSAYWGQQAAQEASSKVGYRVWHPDGFKADSVWVDQRAAAGAGNFNAIGAFHLGAADTLYVDNASPEAGKVFIDAISLQYVGPSRPQGSVKPQSSTFTSFASGEQLPLQLQASSINANLKVGKLRLYEKVGTAAYALKWEKAYTPALSVAEQLPYTVPQATNFVRVDLRLEIEASPEDIGEAFFSYSMSNIPPTLALVGANTSPSLVAGKPLEVKVKLTPARSSRPVKKLHVYRQLPGQSKTLLETKEVDFAAEGEYTYGYTVQPQDVTTLFTFEAEDAAGLRSEPVLYTLNVVTGLEELQAVGLRVYPNPMQEAFVQVVSQQQPIEQLLLWDMQGKKVRSLRPEAPALSLSLPTDGLRPGVYVLGVQVGGKTLRLKVVR